MKAKFDYYLFWGSFCGNWHIAEEQSPAHLTSFNPKRY